MISKGMLRDRARGMRKEPSRAERALWALLRDRQVIGVKFRRQHAIEPYIADFACVEVKLVVEIDGRSHDNAEQAAHDAERTKHLEGRGWRVLRVRDDAVLSDVATVAELIVAEISATPSP